MAVTTFNPKARLVQSKFITITRDDTTASKMAVLPARAVVCGLFVSGEAASDAGTSASISVGTTSTANELVATYDVKTAATGEGFSAVGGAAVGTALMVRNDGNTDIYAKYAESGTASTTGGPWIVRIDYFVTGAGEEL
jgi:hypothetical protein